MRRGDLRIQLSLYNNNNNLNTRLAVFVIILFREWAHDEQNQLRNIFGCARAFGCHVICSHFNF